MEIPEPSAAAPLLEPTLANVCAWLAAKPVNEVVVRPDFDAVSGCLFARFLLENGRQEVECGLRSWSENGERFSRQEFPDHLSTALVFAVCKRSGHPQRAGELLVMLDRIVAGAQEADTPRKET